MMYSMCMYAFPKHLTLLFIISLSFLLYNDNKGNLESGCVVVVVFMSYCTVEFPFVDE